MIIFKTDYERWLLNQKRLAKKCKIKKKFAFFPVGLPDGNYVWLQKYYYVAPISVGLMKHLVPNYWLNCTSYMDDCIRRKNTIFLTLDDAKKSCYYEQWVTNDKLAK